MQIRVDEVEPKMTIDDGSDVVMVRETWPNQGAGLGVVIKGVVLKDGGIYFRRFLDASHLVEKVQP